MPLPCDSHPVGSNGRNNIIAPTPLKFLPVKEFEKRQKSINRNQTRAIMSSAMTKIGFHLMVEDPFGQPRTEFPKHDQFIVQK